jgi:hypothetical protein
MRKGKLDFSSLSNAGSRGTIAQISNYFCPV